MSKELTEKWKNSKLEYGYYYLQTKDGEMRIDRTTCDVISSVYLWTQTDKDYIQEVLAPIPSYEELQKLKKDLDEYALTYKIGNDVNRLTEEENKKLKEQLEEVNEMLLGAKHLTVKDSNGAVMFELVSPEINDYLKKWGVK